MEKSLASLLTPQPSVGIKKLPEDKVQKSLQAISKALD
jgi:hypothetical protein